MDVDSFDFKQRNPDKLIRSVMAKLKKKGKGILLMHDFQKATAKAMPSFSKSLKSRLQGRSSDRENPGGLARQIRQGDRRGIRRADGERAADVQRYQDDHGK